MQSRNNQDYFDAFTKLNKKTKSTTERFGVLLCDLDTCDISQKQLLQRILFDDSSSPHYWLDYIQYIEKLTDKKNSLHKLIIKALDCINETENKDNVQYVKIHLKYAELSTDTAACKYYQNLNKKEIGKRVAQFFLSWSELEAKLLNFENAIDILNKGIHYQAEPVQKLFTKLQLLREQYNLNKIQKISTKQSTTVNKLAIVYDDGEIQIQKDLRRDILSHQMEVNKEDAELTTLTPTIEIPNLHETTDNFLSNMDENLNKNESHTNSSSGSIISKNNPIMASTTTTSTKTATSSSRLATKRSLVATGLGKCQRVKLDGNHSSSSTAIPTTTATTIPTATTTAIPTATHTSSTLMDTTVVLNVDTDNSHNIDNNDNDNDDSEIILNYHIRKPRAGGPTKATTTMVTTTTSDFPGNHQLSQTTSTTTTCSPAKKTNNRKSQSSIISSTRSLSKEIPAPPSSMSNHNPLVLPPPPPPLAQGIKDKETNTISSKTNNMNQVDDISIASQLPVHPLPPHPPNIITTDNIPQQDSQRMTRKRSTSNLRNSRQELQQQLRDDSELLAKHSKVTKKNAPTVITNDVINSVKSETHKGNKESNIYPIVHTSTTAIKSPYNSCIAATSHHHHQVTLHSPLTSSSSLNLDPRHVSQDITEKQLPDLINSNDRNLPSTSTTSRRVSFKVNEVTTSHPVTDDQLTTDLPPSAATVNTTGNGSNDDDSNVIVFNKKQHTKPFTSIKKMISTATTSTKPKSNTTTDTNNMKNKDTIFINGRSYIKLGLLGKGASSSVYRVYSEEDGQLYAYKRVDIRMGMCNGSNQTPPTDHGGDVDDVEVQQSEDMMDNIFKSYINEIELLKKLAGCPYIVEMKEAEVNRSELYVAMIMEAGEVDLAKALHRQKKLQSQNNLPCNPFFSRIVWYEMLLAVDYMHAQRIVHGDLKPANFVFSQGKLKLIDFGIAKAISNDTTNIYRDTTIGTVNYMAPEAICPIQDNGDMKMKLGRASDIWSMGCILYQIIYGNPPFAAFNLMQRMHAITNPNYKIEYPDYHDSTAIETIQSCLQRKPQLRASIKELLSGKFLSVSTGEFTVTTATTSDHLKNHQNVATNDNPILTNNNNSSSSSNNITRGDEAGTTSDSIKSIPMPEVSSVAVAVGTLPVGHTSLEKPLLQTTLDYQQVCQVVKMTLHKSKNTEKCLQQSDENTLCDEIYKELLLSCHPSRDFDLLEGRQQQQQPPLEPINNRSHNNDKSNDNDVNVNIINTNKAIMFAEIRKKSLRSSQNITSTTGSTTTTTTTTSHSNDEDKGLGGGGGAGTKARKPLQTLKTMPTGLRSEILEGKLRLSSLNNLRNIQTNATTTNNSNYLKSSGIDRASRWIRPHGNTPEKLDMKSVIERRMGELRKFLQHDDTEENNLLDISFQNF